MAKKHTLRQLSVKNRLQMLATLTGWQQELVQSILRDVNNDVTGPCRAGKKRPTKPSGRGAGRRT